MDFSKIRLVIWDLDNTLWNGVLSEEKVILRPNIKKYLVKSTKLGLINSINSKNDFSKAEKALKDKRIAQYFVYCDIAYSAKGIRLREQIKNIGISEQFVLFVDDNDSNLSEAMFYNSRINTLNVKNIKVFFDYIESCSLNIDKSGQLKKYKEREIRDIASKSFVDDIDFLRYSEIKICIKEPKKSEFNRIYELLQKTNQLNYTKLRLNEDELHLLLANKNFKNYIVLEQDKFCNSGIIGFFSLKNGVLVHFLFSCRIMNLGIEEYIYEKLNNPQIAIKGDIANPISNFRKNIDWIKEVDQIEVPKKIISKRILLKGPCDMKAILRYLNIDNVLNEMTYVKGTREMVYQNSIANIYMSAKFSKHEIYNELAKMPFNDIDFFKTKLFDDNIDIVLISFISLLNTAIYKGVNNKFFFGMGAVSKPFSNSLFDVDYLDGGINSYNFPNNKKNLIYIRSNYEFVSPLDYVNNYFECHLLTILKKIHASKILIFLGNEMNFLDKTESKGIELFRCMNAVLRKIASMDSRIALIDPNLYIENEDDVFNSLNHYSSKVYYKMAQKIKEYISLDVELNDYFEDNGSKENWRQNKYDYK